MYADGPPVEELDDEELQRAIDLAIDGHHAARRPRDQDDLLDEAVELLREKERRGHALTAEEVEMLDLADDPAQAPRRPMGLPVWGIVAIAVAVVIQVAAILVRILVKD